VKFDLTDVQTNEKSQTYTGPPAPLTSVCLSPDRTELFAGCWDKSIWSWEVATRRSKRRYLGHSDFVKSVISTKLDGKDVLISGGLDSKIIIWDISTGQKLRTMKGHTSGIQDLILDPFVSDESSSPVSLFSAGSDREIRCWNDLLGTNESSEPMLVHETSVYKLYFDADGDMWTASADGDVKNLIRENSWKPEATLTHPDFVRDVVVDENGGWVVTACRDEEIRVWNRAVSDNVQLKI
jgi:WD40 repeat protein